MANYLLAYHGRHGRGRGGTGASHGGVGKWYEDLGASIVDAGTPVGWARSVSSDGS
jgi:hypothetical protein